MPLPEMLSTAFNDVDHSIIGTVRNSFKSYFSWPMPRSARLKMIDSKLQEDGVTEAVLRAQSGSTALVVVIDDEFITLANVGDCRAGTPVEIVVNWCSYNTFFSSCSHVRVRH
jgi:serine/threonine protein phosphatase PrpC